MIARGARRCVLIVLAAMSGCSLFAEPPPTSAPTAPPPPPPAPIAAARAVATRAAFDIATGPAGTFLAWGVPAASGGGVRLLELGPGGAARGSETEIANGSAAASGSAERAPNQVLELALAASGDHLGVAWTVVSGGALRAEASHAAAAPTFAPAADLGEVEPGTSGRGNIVVSALADGALYVAHRITRGPCHDTSSGATECTRFARTRIPQGDSVRGDGASEIAVACAPLLPGAIGGTVSEPWFYAVCHGEAPTTTVFVINAVPSSQYAAAAEVLAGCTPIGLAHADVGIALRARCGDDEAFATVDPLGHVTSEIRHAALTARCDQGRPLLEAREGDRVIVRHLTDSESRIEPWLPGNIAPVGSRAVWTGEAILVATPIGAEAAREVSVRRFECHGAELQRTGPI